MNKQIITLILALVFQTFLMAQQGDIQLEGTVVDGETGMPVPGANVIEKGTTNGVLTDFDGVFSIRVASNAVVEISFIGYATVEVLASSGSPVQVVLETQTSELDEVVVVGYGTQKKSDVTGAVASINTEDLEKMPQVDVSQALQGRMAGMSVSFSGSNAEGGASSMLIRGKNSISADNEPFIVVDGMPYFGNLSEITPSDIASISILKDASSTAIYGARASNGVILITTKKGTRGEAKISLNSYTGFSTIANLPAMQDAETFFETKLTRFGRDNISVTEREGYLQGRDTDWLDLATRLGTRQEHNITISGGAEKVQYFISGTYHKTKGVAKNDDFERATLRVNVDTEIRPWLKIGTSTQLSHYNRDGREVNFEDAFKMNPFAVPFEEDGSIRLTPWPENSFYDNPLEALNVQNQDRTYRVLTSNYLQIDFPFLEGLSYRANVGGSYRYRGVETYYGANTKRGLEQGGVSQMDYWHNLDWTIENLLYYNRSFGDHTVGLTLLYSAQERTVNDHDVDGVGFPSHTRTNYQHGAATVLTGSDNYSVTANLSQMGRLNYSLLDKYLLTFTVRRDGYSGFGSDTKFGTFPSVGLGWNLSREGFMSEIDQIDNLKIRGSYGKTGNQAIGAYSTLPGLGGAHYITESGEPAFGYYPSGIGDPTLSWETTKSFNVGIDFGLFKNRVQGSVDHFRANTTDLLLNRNISYINGTGSIRQNIGETKNRGWEFELSTINVDTGDFQWVSNLNVSTYNNEIVDVSLRDESGRPMDDLSNRWFIGKPIDVNYDYKFGGIFQNETQIFNSAQPDAQVGDVIVVDVNKDGIINEDDRTIIGSRIPDYTLGFSNSFTYKNFTLSAHLTAVQGVSKNNYLTRTFFNGNERSFDYNFWTPENPHNSYPANRDDANPRGVDIFGKANDASFIRLNDVSLSYRMPDSVLDILKLKNLELFLNGKNLVTITDWEGLDPEFNDQMAIPQSRTYLFGVKVDF